MLRSVPRTVKAAAWGVKASLAYKQLQLAHEDLQAEEYKEALHRKHEELAQSLLKLCEDNGSIYIKAAQFVTSIQTVPAEYTK